MIKVKITPSVVVSYKHSIAPVKCGNTFLPNLIKFAEVVSKSKINIILSDFKKHQERGYTILVNFAGGWCTLTSDMEIVK